jgi:putative oxidoreductase
MSTSSGIISPINYSVFTVSAASLLLSTMEGYTWSMDALIAARRINRKNA